MARRGGGHLEICGGPWGTLGGPEEKNTRENFLQKLDIRKVFFSDFFGKTFCAPAVARCEHLGTFGGPWETLGGPEG